MKEETPASQRLLMTFLADVGCALLIYHGHHTFNTTWGKAQFVSGMIGIIAGLIGLFQYYKSKK
jgi:hypothetical protein